MTVKECYEKMGANYENVLSRLGGSEALVKRLVLKFLDDASYQKLEEQLLNKNVEEAFRAAHTLKGVCQNLGFSNLYVPAYTLTETLRAGQLEGTQEQFAKVEEQYQCTMDAIRALD
mgnify:CR=1 FL=1